MGVYHLMGLGRSVGAVTGPLSYLAWRFARWDAADRDFFAGSGELAQRQDGERVGDVQALVLFTTQEVLAGETPCYDYIENQPGQCPASGQQVRGIPMRDALHRLLPRVWRPAAKGRHSVAVYWATIDRTDLLSTFQRAAEVVLAAKSAGRLGKELWINLTGGNNVTNLALQLATELTGAPARFYYVQAASPAAEKCVRFTREEGYWIDLPLLPVRAHEASRKLVAMVAGAGSMDIPALFTQAKGRHWQHFPEEGGLDEFRRSHVQPLVFQGLLERDGDRVRTGPRWPLVEPFYRTLDAVGTGRRLDQLTQEPWFAKEELQLG